MRETRVRSLGQEDPLEKEMVTHSSILAWRIPWTEKPGGLQSTGSQRVGHDWATWDDKMMNELIAPEGPSLTGNTQYSEESFNRLKYISNSCVWALSELLEQLVCLVKKREGLGPEVPEAGSSGESNKWVSLYSEEWCKVVKYWS